MTARRATVLWLLFISTVIPMILSAQTNSGDLYGTITDPSKICFKEEPSHRSVESWRIPQPDTYLPSKGSTLSQRSTQHPNLL